MNEHTWFFSWIDLTSPKMQIGNGTFITNKTGRELTNDIKEHLKSFVSETAVVISVSRID